MSNDNGCENHPHRKTKVSHATVIDVGLVGPKTRAKAVADGHPVNIPEPEEFRQTRNHLKSNQESHFGEAQEAMDGGGVSSGRTPYGKKSPCNECGYKCLGAEICRQIRRLS